MFIADAPVGDSPAMHTFKQRARTPLCVGGCLSRHKDVLCSGWVRVLVVNVRGHAAPGLFSFNVSLNKIILQ